jgi:eukaryotic-like serine/threonine-protein kinase
MLGSIGVGTPSGVGPTVEITSMDGVEVYEEPRDERFEVAGLLGRGGCAVVFKAFDRWLGRDVALKVLQEDRMNEVAVARLEREARAAIAINHPNVCSTFDHGVLADGRPFVTLELLEGETLRQRLARTEQLDTEVAIEIAVQVLAGLDAAHETGLVHRDIKPENIFITKDGDRLLVKVVDFGVCRSAIDPVDQKTLTCAGYVVGTPGYLAPEQVYGERTVDPRADVFAVGLILFEMLSGRAAFQGDNPMELALALAQRVPSLSEVMGRKVSLLLDRVVAQATEHEPSWRYPTAAMFLHDLLEVRTALRRDGYRRVVSGSAAYAMTVEVEWGAPTRQVSVEPRRVA